MSLRATSSPSIRVLVRGSSTVSWISDVQPGRVSHAYPRALESALRQDGWSADVRVSAPLAASSLHILRDADADVFDWDPDVIVLNTGHMENLHLLVPIPWARHVFTRTARPGRWRRFYRRQLMWPVYRVVTRVQARLEPAIGGRVFGRRRAAVIAHVNRFITMATGNGHPLIIVMGLVPPTQTLPEFPGLAARIEIMNEEFRAVVERRDDADIVWFDPSDVLATDGPPIEVALGDGLHYNADAHAAVGRRLAEVVEKWAAQQAHLAASPSPLR